MVKMVNFYVCFTLIKNFKINNLIKFNDILELEEHRILQIVLYMG